LLRAGVRVNPFQALQEEEATLVISHILVQAGVAMEEGAVRPDLHEVLDGKEVRGGVVL
jgi:hypothetical protein